MAPTPNPEILDLQTWIRAEFDKAKAAYTAFHCAVCDAEAVYAVAAYHDERDALDAFSTALDIAYAAYDAATAVTR